MWNSSLGRSSTSSHQHHQRTPTASTHGSTQKGKTPAKAKTEEWETLKGWVGDTADDIETIDIGAWSKRSSKRKEDTPNGSSKEARVAYLCWTTNRCTNIPDFDEFVSDSLATSLKPAESAPSASPDPAVKQTKSKTQKVGGGRNKSPSSKKEDSSSAGEQQSRLVKSSDEDARACDLDSEASGDSMAGRRAISTAYTASECSRGPDCEDSDAAASGSSARTVGVSRSAPVARAQDRRDQKNRKIASATSRADSSSGSKPKEMRRVAIRNSAAKSPLDLNRLTLDLPNPPPNGRTNPHQTSHVAEEEAGNTAQSQSEAEKAAVLRLVEERLKRTSASNRLNFDLLPNAGTVSVGDLLSSSPRIVHRVGPTGDAGRDPNVYAALTGGIAGQEALSPWSHGDNKTSDDSAIVPSAPRRPHGDQHLGITPNGSRNRDTSKSILPAVSPPVGVAAPQFESASTSDSIKVRQTSPVEGANSQCTSGPDEERLLKNQQRIIDLIRKTTPLWDPRHYDGPTETKRAKGREDHSQKRPSKTKAPSTRSKQAASVVLGRKLAANSSQNSHRGPPGFRPAGKTPLQRAIENAHKKMHGQHYYLFTHSSNPPPIDVNDLPRYSSSGQPVSGQLVSGHRERASSGRSNQSERSINNAYVWKEHLENQIKQQRSTNAQQKKAQFQFQLGERQGKTADFVSMFDRNGHAMINKPKAIICVGTKGYSSKPGTT